MKLPFATVLVCGALVAASTANAVTTIEASVNGTEVAFSSSVSGTPVSLSSNAFGVSVTLFGAISNAPGTPTLSSLISSTLNIVNNNTVNTNLELVISDNNYSAPTAPPSLDLHSHIGGSVTVGNAANLLTMLSCVDQGNVGGGCPRTYNTPPQHPNVTANSFNNDSITTISSLSSPFAISEVIDLTLGPDTQLNFAANTTLSPAPVPLRAALPLFATGLGALGLLGWRRKRKAATAA
jgi:hypothetical protein